LSFSSDDKFSTISIITLVQIQSSHIYLEVDLNSDPISKVESDRLDRYLSDYLPQFSRSRLQNLIQQGYVLVNDQPCRRKNTNVKDGDQITLIIPPVKEYHLQPEEIPLDVLYEDDQLIIINKPAGLVVHPAAGNETGTLVNALLAHCATLSGIGGIERPGIVHRLDKDTTGAIMVAKTELALKHLQEQIRTKTAKREYLGFVHGVPKTESGTINLPIGRHPVDRKKMAVVPEEKGGKTAITHWKLRERLGNYSLLHFCLETGRTHQIRVHSSHVGHPLLGDPVYGSGRSVGVNLTGQALHAFKLTVTHPVTGEIIEAMAPLPEELEKLLRVLTQ
jgi:23S rRNA pseudouridine1911/1915/1917 synthase